MWLTELRKNSCSTVSACVVLSLPTCIEYSTKEIGYEVLLEFTKCTLIYVDN